MVSAERHRYQAWGLGDVLRNYRGLTISPEDGENLLLKGNLEFEAHLGRSKPIADSYSLEIRVPVSFPHDLPKVRELAGRIPRYYHTNPDDTLCLGSSLGLHLALHEQPTLKGFIETCVVPYLAGHSHYEQTGELLFGELKHGDEGLIEEYMSVFRVRTVRACVEMLNLMGMKKRHANKKPCPCDSGLRAGKCHHTILNPLRKRLGRPWCRREYGRWLAKRAS